MDPTGDRVGIGDEVPVLEHAETLLVHRMTRLECVLVHRLHRRSSRVAGVLGSLAALGLINVHALSIAQENRPCGFLRQQLEDDNGGLTLSDVRVIEAHVGRSGQLGFLIGQSVRSAYLRMCGFAALPRQTLAENEPALVPAAHVPALCGMLLGIELVKGSVPELAPFRLDHLFQFDTRYALKPSFQLTALQLLDGPCVCQDPRYQAAYRAKWPAA